jgi:predicted MFS family arabinose efflux permease
MPLLPLLTIIRIVINTAYRMAYPFLGVIARGLGVDVSVISAWVANRYLVSAISPFLLPALEPRGRRFNMLLGLGIITAGTALVVFFPTLPGFAASLMLVSVGKIIFDTSIQAFLGDQVAYEQRGRAVAMLETSWSLAFVLGMPVAGFLVARFGWMAPFPLFTLLILTGLGVLAFLLPRDPAPVTVAKPYANVRLVLASPQTRAALVFTVAVLAANEVVGLIFGVWLEDSFGLKIAALAGAATVIGLSELSGEGLVAAFSDRLGKVRAASAGLILNCLAVLALPWIGRTAPGALLGLFLFYITFEFLVVSSITVMTEIAPGARATFLSFNVVAGLAGRAGADFLAPVLYDLGFPFVTFAAVLFNAIALLAIRYLARHHR